MSCLRLVAEKINISDIQQLIFRSQHSRQIFCNCITIRFYFPHSSGDWKSTSAKCGQFGSLFSTFTLFLSTGELQPGKWIVGKAMCPQQFHHEEMRKGNITDEFTYTVVRLPNPPSLSSSPLTVIVCRTDDKIDASL